MNGGTYDDGFADGQLREKIREHDRRLIAINGSIDRAETTLAGLRTDVDVFFGKVKVWGFVAVSLLGLISPIVTGIVVFSLTHN